MRETRLLAPALWSVSPCKSLVFCRPVLPSVGVPKRRSIWIIFRTVAECGRWVHEGMNKIYQMMNDPRVIGMKFNVKYGREEFKIERDDVS